MCCWPVVHIAPGVDGGVGGGATPGVGAGVGPGAGGAFGQHWRCAAWSICLHACRSDWSTCCLIGPAQWMPSMQPVYEPRHVQTWSIDVPFCVH